MSWIKKTYVDTGQVRFVYKHFAILGPESNRSAEASECAAEQQRFWTYHDLLFEKQAANEVNLTDEFLIDLARDIELDVSAFETCLTSNRYADQIRQESAVVESMGMRGTPGFLINGNFISGAQPFEVFQRVIEDQLAGLQTEADNQPATAEPTAQTVESSVKLVGDDEIDGVIFFPEQTFEHQDDPIEYDYEAPAGGDHSDQWQNCGIYDEPIELEHVVHSMEHGAVWLAYEPDLANEQVELLRYLVRQEQQTRGEALIVLAPMPDLEAPIVTTAWQVQLNLEEAGDERLPLFLARYQKGPFTPEPEAPCTEGVGNPLR